MSMMSELKDKKVGLNDIENFSIGLQYNLKSDKMKDQQNKPTEKIIRAAMTMKQQDENHHQKELKRL